MVPSCNSALVDGDFEHQVSAYLDAAELTIVEKIVESFGASYTVVI